ncbi:MAG: polysaccharide pyruvyl transferase family protein [Clostridiales bacterium]|nr:polysaccharide pyruvyl transferase family protein [Clostridiales bacterium]
MSDNPKPGARKILLVTFSRNVNYGGSLQEFALFACLSRRFDVKCLDYRHGMVAATVRPVRVGFIVIAFSTVRSVFSRKKIGGGAAKLEKSELLPELMNRVYGMVSDIVNYGKRRRLIANYRRFWDTYIAYTQEYAEESVAEGFSGYDAAVSGSDQIWNPMYFGVTPVYFLGFLPEGVRRVAYSASFGNYKFADRAVNERIAGYLRAYSAVSVREAQHVGKVREALGIEAVCALDPTLMLTRGEWLSSLGIEDEREFCVNQAKSRDDTLVVYALSNRVRVYGFAKKLAKILGLTPVIIDQRFLADLSPSTRYESTADPRRFVELLARARFVVTNSFHGTAFAVNFNIPFYAVACYRNERASSLLSQTGLMDRMADLSGDWSKWLTPGAAEVDFSASNAALGELRRFSADYLERALADD